MLKKIDTQTTRQKIRRNVPGPCRDACGGCALGRVGALAYCEPCWYLRRTMKEAGVRTFARLEGAIR